MTTNIRMHLQPWYDNWLKANADTDLLWVDRNNRGEPYLHQIRFMRALCAMIWQDVPYENRKQATPRDDLREEAWVVGEHRSKSIVLPVYSIERPDLGLTLTLRYNFYDWTVSVKSELQIRPWVKDYGDPCCFFEGFPPDRQYQEYGRLAHGWQNEFSLSIHNDYELYAFVRQLMAEVRSDEARAYLAQHRQAVQL